MSWTLEYTRRAARDLRRLDPSVRRRIRAAVETLAEDPLRGKPLQFQLRGFRSWRTGAFRIVYQVREREIVILVVAVGHRRDVYERLRDRPEPSD